MKQNILFWNQSSKSLNVFSMFLARVVHVSISSRVETFAVYPGESYRTVMFLSEMTAQKNHRGNFTSNLANCRPQNAWECLSRANKKIKDLKTALTKM